MTRIKELRKMHDMTQVELADFLHVHQTAISQWETGRTAPDIEQYAKMAILFGTTIDDLMGYDRGHSAPSPRPATPPRPTENTVTLFGRDGSKTDRTLTEEQYKLILGLLDQMPGEDKK